MIKPNNMVLRSRLLPAVLAVVTGAVLMSGCGKKEEEAATTLPAGASAAPDAGGISPAGAAPEMAPMTAKGKK